MDCRETQTLLSAFHDGELADGQGRPSAGAGRDATGTDAQAADRARVEEHLRGCPECTALLAGLARVDHAAGVPDPGPAYWDRFNARVMDRIAREVDSPGATVLRPKGGWMRQQLRYLVPAAAAAALVVVIVHYGGMTPPTPTTAMDGQVPGQAGMPPVLQSRPTARDGLVPGQAGMPPVPQSRPTAMDGQVPGQAGMPPVLQSRPTAMDGQVPGQAGMPPVPQSRPTAMDGLVPGQAGMPPVLQSRPTARDGQVSGQAGTPRVLEPRPPVPDKERFAAVTREERDRLADRPPPAGNVEASRDRATAPAGIGEPSPPPTPLQSAPDGQGWPSAGAGRDATGSVAPADGSPQVAEQQAAGKAKAASGIGIAKESPAGSSCELARALAERERFREAEAAQRACLAQDPSAPAREKGLVFLAELLDRQARFADADAVIAEVDRLYPQSRPLDLYRQQRPMVQKQPMTAPGTR